MRLLASLGAISALMLFSASSAFGQNDPGSLSYNRDNGVVVYPTPKPALNPWDDVRPMLGSVGAFIAGDLMLSFRLVQPRSDIAQVVLFGGIYAPLLDFTVRMNALGGYRALGQLGGLPEWGYQVLGATFTAYGLVKAVIHTRAVFWGGGQSVRGPRIALVPYSGGGVFGLAFGGTF